MFKSEEFQRASYKQSPLSGVEIAHRFFAGTASSYDMTVHLWTVGMDWWWKKKIVDKIPPTPKRILDQGCGTGILTFRMAKNFPTCQITGVELHQEYISQAAKKAKAIGLKNVNMILGRAEHVHLRQSFDCITSSYLVKYTDMDCLIRGASHMLREGGVLIIHDFTYPRNRLVAFVLDVYFRLMQTLGRHSFPQWETVFYELGDFLKQSAWVYSLITSLKKHDFTQIRIERLTLGMATIVTATNSPSA